MTALSKLAVSITAMAIVVTAPALARADEVADFYRGKTVTLYLGYPPGGGYDVYARMLIAHMPRFMPGNPQFLLRHKPGAASLNLVGELYNVMPRDGASFAMFARSVAIGQLLGRPGTNFKAQEFNWIGSANNEVSFCGVWHEVGIKSTEDFFKRELVFGANAPGAESDVFPTVMNNLFGTKFKVVAGYPGANDLTLALERREIDVRCGWTLGGAKSSKADWLRDKKITIPVAFSTVRHPDLADVPLITELAKTEEQRQVLNLILTQQVMGRPVAAPPGVPPARVAALRNAFMQALKDPEVLAEAEKLWLEIDPVDGATLQGIVDKMFQTPTAIVDATKRAIGQK